MIAPRARILFRGLRTAQRFARARKGGAAVEFAIILPMMLVLFFGTVELSNGVAVDRKVTLTARTLSDLVSQAASVTDNDLSSCYDASGKILDPYDATPLQAYVAEIKIDASSKATIAWVKAFNGYPTPPAVGTVVALPTALVVPSTYLIYSKVNYSYTPVVGYVMKTALNLTDQFYTRPRQSMCVLLNGATSCP